MSKTNTGLIRPTYSAPLVILLTPLIIIFQILLYVYRVFFPKTVAKSITGDIAVVTGGAGGLGRAISVELAKQGCHIVIVDVNFELAEQTATSIHEKYKVKTKAYKVDVTNYDEVVELNKNISNDIGKATILVNNAGILSLSDPFNPDPIEVQRMINVNLTSHFWTNRVFLQNMKELNKGHIVAISSVAGLMPLPFNAQYTSTKYAVRGLMGALKLELVMQERRCIKTTTVFPTFLDTNSEAVRLLEKSNSNKIFILHNGEEVAKRIIQGVLRNEEIIAIPDIASLFTRCLEFWPHDIIAFFISMTYSKNVSKEFKDLAKKKL
ncbi:estradiol 17-beta-dehydrogenase 11-like [Teleopsis dalmanni]|uniref:estradiol 17-beta-dehydrogenase 11-like n=1 Tax=Teleopsis dalmanni TaxID=139649 RepID=UPI0018CFCD9A|nr:estradiol 17-beta-dehydrogenase 11-like [Teleopsis dalmanni]